jgi:scyllo-inositol 2-dehydrogenase (NADP+)
MYSGELVKPIRLGVVGLGLIWLREHKPSLERLKEEFVPVAFCDVSEERRQAVAQEFPDAQVVADYEVLLQNPEVETVLVLTPIAFNAPVALAALRAGKDVIMEKPIARSVAEGQTLIDAARQAGRRLLVTEQLAYRSSEEILAEVIASGEIGDVVLWERVQHWEADTAQGPLRYASTPWRKEANFPLGTLFDGGIHLIASLSKVFGAPARASATGKKWRAEYGEFDQVVMLFEYANGMSGVLSHSTCLSSMQNHFHIHGTEGIITVDSRRLIVQKHEQPERTIDLPEDNGRAAMWQAFINAYRQGQEPYYTAERALQDVAILEAVDQSIRAGQKISVMNDEF